MKHEVSIRKIHSYEWLNLGKVEIKERTLLITRAGEYYPFNPFPKILSTQVIMDECDKNFVYHWLTLHRRVFPNLSELYLNSHPCEPSVMRLLDSAPFKTYLSENYWIYHDHWLSDRKKSGKIYKFSDSDMSHKIYTCDQTQLLLSKT